MAPEYIVHGQLTEKADIYSYGVLVLEIVTGRKNQSSISTSAEGYSLMQQVKLFSEISNAKGRILLNLYWSSNKGHNL